MLAEVLLEKIRNDRGHGATELAIMAIEGIRQTARSLESEGQSELRHIIQNLVVSLATSRPSIVALSNLLEQLLQAFTRVETEDFKMLVDQSCEDILVLIQKARSRAVKNMLGLIKADDVVMTHSISSTVKNVFLELKRAQARNHIIVTESRPGDEGKILAEFLAEIEIATTYITEAQIDLWMPEADMVVVGADAVLADGSVLNKCGTNLMALSANYHNVPVYVCAETFKQSANNHYELEKMDPNELKVNIAGVSVSNTYFEKVPVDLITAWVN